MKDGWCAKAVDANYNQSDQRGQASYGLSGYCNRSGLSSEVGIDWYQGVHTKFSFRFQLSIPIKTFIISMQLQCHHHHHTDDAETWPRDTFSDFLLPMRPNFGSGQLGSCARKEQIRKHKFQQPPKSVSAPTRGLNQQVLKGHDPKNR